MLSVPPGPCLKPPRFSAFTTYTLEFLPTATAIRLTVDVLNAEESSRASPEDPRSWSPASMLT
jgi:hypothetical protein